MLETTKYTETLGAALADVPVDESEQAKDDGFIHLSTGVILSPKKVTPFLFQSITLQFKDPDVPVVWIEAKQREEANPMHPSYIKAKEETEMMRSMALIDAVIALGTKLVSIPADFQSPDSEEWLDDLEAAEIKIDRNNRRLRYRTWVKFVAAPSVDDVQLIISKVLNTLGVSEEMVATATANFRR